MNMDRAYKTFVVTFVLFYALNVVISLLIRYRMPNFLAYTSDLLTQKSFRI